MKSTDYKEYTQKVCGNCGLKGHIYVECTGPITSLGIVAFRKNKKDILQPIFKNYLQIKPEGLTPKVREGTKSVDEGLSEQNRTNKVKLLLVQRKDTMGYIDFLRGKDPDYLNVYINEMIPEELERLLTFDFDTLWDDLWNDHTSKYYKNEKKKCKAIFEKLDLHNLIDLNKKSLWAFQEFGIPKGRKNIKENFRDCAIREFEEETGYSRSDYKMIDTKPVEEQFKGSNGINYKHIYYLAIINDDAPVPSIDKNNRHQSNEIKNVGFFTKKEACSLIRNYDTEKKKVIIRCFNIYYNYIKKNKY
jgi:ADP-ribose pyrophosphatase YjhB (NUDIX family)